MKISIFICYLIGINLVTLAVYGSDKLAAVRHRNRISERTLLRLACAGGSVGALAGMYLFRHKTRKQKFVIGIPTILAVQAVVIFAVCRL